MGLAPPTSGQQEEERTIDERIHGSQRYHHEQQQKRIHVPQYSEVLQAGGEWKQVNHSRRRSSKQQTASLNDSVHSLRGHKPGDVVTLYAKNTERSLEETDAEIIKRIKKYVTKKGVQISSA